MKCKGINIMFLNHFNSLILLRFKSAKNIEIVF